MNKPFETDGLHGEPQPAKPITGDQVGDQPATPPAGVSEQSEFSQEINCMVINKQVSSNTASNLTAAHNRDMSEARKRIAELEKYIQEMVNIAAENRLDGYRELANKCAELEGQLDSARRTTQYWKDEHIAGNKRIAAFAAENARLRADKAKLERVQGGGDVPAFITLKKRIDELE